MPLHNQVSEQNLAEYEICQYHRILWRSELQSSATRHGWNQSVATPKLIHTLMKQNQGDYIGIYVETKNFGNLVNS